MIGLARAGTRDQIACGQIVNPLAELVATGSSMARVTAKTAAMVKM